MKMVSELKSYVNFTYRVKKNCLLKIAVAFIIRNEMKLVIQSVDASLTDLMICCAMWRLKSKQIR